MITTKISRDRRFSYPCPCGVPDIVKRDRTRGCLCMEYVREAMLNLFKDRPTGFPYSALKREMKKFKIEQKDGTITTDYYVNNIEKGRNTRIVPGEIIQLRIIHKFYIMGWIETNNHKGEKVNLFPLKSCNCEEYCKGASSFAERVSKWAISPTEELLRTKASYIDVDFYKQRIELNHSQKAFEDMFQEETRYYNERFWEMLINNVWWRGKSIFSLWSSIDNPRSIRSKEEILKALKQADEKFLETMNNSNLNVKKLNMSVVLQIFEKGLISKK